MLEFVTVYYLMAKKQSKGSLILFWEARVLGPNPRPITYELYDTFGKFVNFLILHFL